MKSVGGGGVGGGGGGRRSQALALARLQDESYTLKEENARLKIEIGSLRKHLLRHRQDFERRSGDLEARSRRLARELGECRETAKAAAAAASRELSRVEASHGVALRRSEVRSLILWGWDKGRGIDTAGQPTNMPILLLFYTPQDRALFAERRALRAEALLANAGLSDGGKTSSAAVADVGSSASTPIHIPASPMAVKKEGKDDGQDEKQRQQEQHAQEGQQRQDQQQQEQQRQEQQQQQQTAVSKHAFSPVINGLSLRDFAGEMRSLRAERETLELRCQDLHKELLIKDAQLDAFRRGESGQVEKEEKEEEGKTADRSGGQDESKSEDVVSREEHDELVALLEEEMATMRLGFEKRVGELEHELEATRASRRRS